ncbi:MAG TPA: hypothetical protein VIV61_01355 [Candidatus Ozemobacteraceae bacterium]
MTRRSSLLVVLALACAAPTAVPLPARAVQDAVKDYPVLSYSAANVKAFAVRVAGEHAKVMKALRAKYPDKPEKQAKNASAVAYAKLVADAQALLAAMETPQGSGDAAHEFIRLQRLHYALLADMAQAPEESPLGKLGRRFRMFSNVLGGSLAMSVPEGIAPEQPIGPLGAKREAARLFKAGSTTPVSREELSRLSPVEISRLQPAPDHPALSGKAPGNNFQDFVNEQVSLIRACEKKLARFDLGYARRILFYDELKEDATSPKITVKDRYGLTWKLKWGDEVHTDVAMTRLAIDLGASFEDLKFYSGPGESLLILTPPDKTGPDAVHSFSRLSEMLLNSKFQFHADRYLLDGNLVKNGNTILGHGIVDKQMAERESIDPKYVGAAFVKFKECQLSLYNPAIKRLGGAALSTAGAETDRVTRGSIVFNAWIKNKDMKDDNARVGLVYNLKTRQFDRTVEFQSDLGCTLGGLKPSGELNSFEPSFVRTRLGTINFVMRPLYVPRAWKDCSWADARWMALRIAKLSRADLERCFAESGWPSFAQKVAVERLISRRNELIQPFRLDLDGIKTLPCEPDFTLRVTRGGETHLPVLKGKINGDSAIVRELEASTHPEGLATVISRKND